MVFWSQHLKNASGHRHQRHRYVPVDGGTSLPPLPSAQRRQLSPAEEDT
jgi:hypothetical protein